MDGVEALVNVTIIAATNRPDILDAALLRPGRMDRILYVAPPDFATRKEILRIQLSKMSIGEDVLLDKLAERTDGFSGAETVQITQEAGFEAMTESLSTPAVCWRHFESALSKMTPRISQEMLDFYDVFQKRSGLKVL